MQDPADQLISEIDRMGPFAFGGREVWASLREALPAVAEHRVRYNYTPRIDVLGNVEIFGREIAPDQVDRLIASWQSKMR